MNTDRPTRVEHPVVTDPVRGRQIDIGAGFSAMSFDHKQFDGLMDPLVIVDHFTMSEPTFGPHPHAGMSAVSVLFEDSRGLFHNRDSLGHDIDLEPGDLYWLKAGRGAVHDEGPRPGAQTHAFQVFVNLPAAAKRDAPDSLHIRAEDMPELRGGGYRVRVVLGGSNGVSGFASPASPLTILDAHLEAGGGFTHRLPSGHHAWIHAVRGGGQVIVGDAVVSLARGDAVAVGGHVKAAALELRSEEGAELVLLQGQPLREPIAQRGPFVMNTTEELAAVAAAHAAGELGSIG
ncbi:MAG: pirin-like C-terminal cupin domain-containing protein [Acidobacteriota bacterium]